MAHEGKIGRERPVLEPIVNNPFGSTRTICTPPANGLRYRNTDAEEVVGFGR
jgi:hypothetical protein